MEVTIRPKNFKLQPDIETQVRKRVDRITHHLENLELVRSASHPGADPI